MSTRSPGRASSIAFAIAVAPIDDRQQPLARSSRRVSGVMPR